MNNIKGKIRHKFNVNTINNLYFKIKKQVNIKLKNKVYFKVYFDGENEITHGVIEHDPVITPIREALKIDFNDKN